VKPLNVINDATSPFLVPSLLPETSLTSAPFYVIGGAPPPPMSLPAALPLQPSPAAHLHLECIWGPEYLGNTTALDDRLLNSTCVARRLWLQRLAEAALAPDRYANQFQYILQPRDQNNGLSLISCSTSCWISPPPPHGSSCVHQLLPPSLPLLAKQMEPPMEP